jgi:hypothetical protein
MWMILRFLKPYKHLPKVLRTVAPLRRFVQRQITTDDKLHRWFGAAIPFPDQFVHGVTSVKVVPLLAVGGVWAALGRACSLCDVCHRPVPSGVVIDSGLWVLAHTKTCLRPNVCSSTGADDLTGLGRLLRVAGAPRTEQGMYVRGSGWVPPGVFPHAWTVYGAAALASNYCGLHHNDAEEARRTALELSLERMAMLEAAGAAAQAMTKMARAQARAREEARLKLIGRKRDAREQRMAQLAPALEACVPERLRSGRLQGGKIRMDYLKREYVRGGVACGRLCDRCVTAVRLLVACAQAGHDEPLGGAEQQGGPLHWCGQHAAEDRRGRRSRSVDQLGL